MTMLKLHFIRTNAASIRPTIDRFRKLLNMIMIKDAKNTLIRDRRSINASNALSIRRSFKDRRVLQTIGIQTRLRTLFTRLTSTEGEGCLRTTTVNRRQAIRSIRLVRSTDPLSSIRSKARMRIMHISRSGLDLSIILRLIGVRTFRHARYTRQRRSENLGLPIIYYGRADTNVQFKIHVLWFGFRYTKFSLFLSSLVMGSVTSTAFSSIDTEQDASLVSFA